MTYETATKPALSALRTAALAWTKGTAPVATLKPLCDAAARAGATRAEMTDAIGGTDRWNKFVRAVKRAAR